MDHIPLLDELAVIAGLGVVVTVLLGRLRLPTVAGLLFAGALLGPFGLRLVSSMAAIEVLAELGVVLLLFTIGLEFSLDRLRDVMRQAAVGGTVQVGLTTAAAIVIATTFGQSLARGVFYGFVFSLSSTAIVLRALAERREVDAPHGRFIVGTLIFQDLCVVPMVLVLAFLGEGADPAAAAGRLIITFVKAAASVVAIALAARLLMPRILAWVDTARSREIFLLAILAICIGSAYFTSVAGLSLALGAFLGGMAVADTVYGHRALSEVLPLRDTFVSVFFISLGMLFDVRVVLEETILVALLTCGFLFGKGLLATLAAFTMRFPARVAWLAGVGLAQFSEFGFVLTKLAQKAGIIGTAEARPLLASGIITMFLTPVLVRIAPHVTAGERLLAPLERLIGVRSIDDADAGDPAGLSGHVVLVGYGVAGQLVARALTECGVPFVAIELNAATVRDARDQNLPVYYGDATSVEALGHAHLATARALVLLMNDPVAMQRVIDTARRVSADVPILARARYIRERDPLEHLGATRVVVEEVEGGLEMVAHILRVLEVPRNVIDERIERARAETQPSERLSTVPRPTLAEHGALAELKIESALVRAGSAAAGKSAKDLEIRKHTGALVVALARAGNLVEQPAAVAFLVDDIVYLVGEKHSVERAVKMFFSSPAT
jgi:CPA2 family monovalent cation:H+ antiporter-2